MSHTPASRLLHQRDLLDRGATRQARIIVVEATRADQVDRIRYYNRILCADAGVTVHRDSVVSIVNGSLIHRAAASAVIVAIRALGIRRRASVIEEQDAGVSSRGW